MAVLVCQHCAVPTEPGRIFCKNCRRTLQLPTPLTRFSDQSASEPADSQRESGSFLAEFLLEGLFEGGLEAGELFLYLLVPLILMFGLYLAAGMVYHLMYDPNAIDVASRLDLLSINPDKWFPRS